MNNTPIPTFGLSEFEETVLQKIDVAKVFSGTPVGFALYTIASAQYVGFYNETRNLVIGARTIDSPVFSFTTLPETLGWDSHNYISLSVDKSGRLHVLANMHGDPLKYYRTRVPGDISTFEKIPMMTGENESRVTYPEFLLGPSPESELVFTYRDGGSGNGNQIYNIWNDEIADWRRLLNTPLTDGESERNAYFNGPIKGPDGYYHLVWVWRETPDASTNHSPTYARSRDLVHWERGDAGPIELPITLAASDVIDPIPPGGGIINGNVRIGFDNGGRVVVSYHKYDSNRYVQVFNARLEDRVWISRQASNWDLKWEFGGYGTLAFELQIGPVHAQTDGRLVQRYVTRSRGSGCWLLDSDSLNRIAEVSDCPPFPRALMEPADRTKQVMWTLDGSGQPSAEERYVLRCETYPANRDLAPDRALPPPSTLVLYRLSAGKQSGPARSAASR
jgi:hypothetical protein